MGAAARKRIRDGGPTAKGRPALSVEAYRRLRTLVAARERWRCGFCGDRGTELDHVVLRSAGGADSWANVYWCCRTCNRRRAWSFLSGRLVVTALGDGRFSGAIYARKDDEPTGAVELWTAAKTWGRAPTDREREILTEIGA